MTKKPIILITNDDGINAEGIKHLRRAMDKLGTTYVFAPMSEKSGASHSFSLRKPLEVLWRDKRTTAVDGTPTDCVMLAVRGLLKFKPDLVVSGINHGPNLGDDVTYTGTVAGAMEGTLLGIPSIAVSCVSWKKCDFRSSAVYARRVAEVVLKKGLPQNTLLNVNVPGGTPGGVDVTTLGKRIYRDELTLVQEQDGRRRYQIYGDEPGFHDEPGTDLAAVAAGRIAVTPIHFDLTAHAEMEALRGYDLARLLAPAARERE